MKESQLEKKKGIMLEGRKSYQKKMFFCLMAYQPSWVIKQ